MATFFSFRIVEGNSLIQQLLHFGQICLACLKRFIILCNMEANGVTPIPVPISTACSASKI